MNFHPLRFGHFPVAWFPRTCSLATSVCSALIASAALAAQAGAAVILSLGESKNPSSGGSNPSWVTATFADIGTNSVRLTIDPSGLHNPLKSLTEMRFNIRPDYSKKLNFAFVDPSPKIKGFSVKYAMNQKTIHGRGKLRSMGAFDLLVNLAPPGDLVTYNDQVVIDIFGKGLKASDFAYATKKGYYTAAKIQRLSGGGSTQIFATSLGAEPSLVAVPEPGSIAPLVALISCGLLLRSRRIDVV